MPFFGIDAVILDPVTGKLLEGPNVEGVLCVAKPWPSIARTVYRDHKRYLETYMNVSISFVVMNERPIGMSPLCS